MFSITSSCSTEDKEWLRGRPLRDKDSRGRRVKPKEKGFLHPRVRGLMRRPLALRAQGTGSTPAPAQPPSSPVGKPGSFCTNPREREERLKTGILGR